PTPPCRADSPPEASVGRIAAAATLVKPRAEVYRERPTVKREDAMAELPDRAHIVVIGAGVVGSAAVHHLAELGWRDIVLLEQGPLPDPGGSTGHASNFVFPVDHSKEITDLTVDSLRQYADLGVLSPCGGIEVARSAERMQELRRRMSSARAWGVAVELLSPGQIQELVPHCETSLLIGGFHTPTGAIVDPVRAGELMRERAERLGALT